jgi:hypothetical protein
LTDIISDAAAWHRSALYRDTMLAKAAGKP